MAYMGERMQAGTIFHKVVEILLKELKEFKEIRSVIDDIVNNVSVKLYSNIVSAF